MTQAKVSLRLADTFESEMNELKVDIHQGYGELLDHRTVKVTGGKGTNVTFTADNVIVATGSRPEFHGSSEPKLVNSEELLRTPTVPEKLMIVGAGYIGCEFASIYRTLGCAVTIIEQKEPGLARVGTRSRGTSCPSALEPGSCPSAESACYFRPDRTERGRGSSPPTSRRGSRSRFGSHGNRQKSKFREGWDSAALGIDESSLSQSRQTDASASSRALCGR